MRRIGAEGRIPIDDVQRLNVSDLVILIFSYFIVFSDVKFFVHLTAWFSYIGRLFQDKSIARSRLVREDDNDMSDEEDAGRY